MRLDYDILDDTEKIILALRALYRSCGYARYRMGKFEEYDLYSRNKDFLISDNVITFTDTNGKLMALKPDVTLSIIKNHRDDPDSLLKLCYNENVYRVAKGGNSFREIMQAGLECIGALDRYDLYEVVSLAAESLALISEDFVLDVSHLGILTAMLEESSGDVQLRRELTRYIAAKNRHDLERVCRENGISPEKTAAICKFIGIYGDMDSVLRRLEPLCTGEAARAALAELEQLRKLLDDCPWKDKIHFDFSIVNDMDYYNGIVFQGFLSGICESVLSGGQYDKLIQKMGRSGGAVGFALYLDLLEDLGRTERDRDVDVLLLYDEEDAALAARETKRLIGEGKSVSAQRAIPEKLRYGQVLDLRKEGRV